MESDGFSQHREFYLRALTELGSAVELIRVWRKLWLRFVIADVTMSSYDS